MEVSRRSFLTGAAAGTAGIIASTAFASGNIAHAEPAPDAAPEATGGDGTYSATAKGLGGDVTVTLTIENGALAAVAAEPDATFHLTFSYSQITNSGKLKSITPAG